MQFSKGSKLKIRRSPSEPVQDAIVIDIIVDVDSYRMGVRVLLEIQGDGPRPNEQVWLGVFHLQMWLEWAANDDDDPHDSRERGERPED